LYVDRFNFPNCLFSHLGDPLIDSAELSLSLAEFFKCFFFLAAEHIFQIVIKIFIMIIHFVHFAYFVVNITSYHDHVRAHVRLLIGEFVARCIFIKYFLFLIPNIILVFSVT
jgi:hypothetical protein